MIQFAIRTDLVNLLHHLIACHHPLAEANQVTITFNPPILQFAIFLDTRSFISDFSSLLSKLIIFTPQHHHIQIRLKKVQNGNGSIYQVLVHSSGATLEIPQKEISDFHYPTKLHHLMEGSLYTIEIGFNNEIELSGEGGGENWRLAKGGNNTPAFYKKFMKQLRSNIPSYRNLERQTILRDPGKGLIIQKINSIILTQLGNESFDTNSLAKALAMSRSKLYRTLKPLIRQSPGQYIRYIRLEKAKEMLLKTNLTVGEISLRVGFPDQSHFGRAFKNQYGFNPSQMRVTYTAWQTEGPESAISE